MPGDHAKDWSDWHTAEPRIPLGRPGWEVPQSAHEAYLQTRAIADSAAIEANTSYYKSKKALEHVEFIEKQVAQAIRNMTSRIKGLEG